MKHTIAPKIIAFIALLSILSIHSGYAQHEIHEPVGELVLDVGIIYKVKSVVWLDKHNGLVKKVDEVISITINETNDTLTTSVPIVNGKWQNKFKILQSKTYKFTGMPAQIYGTEAIDMDLIDITSKERIRILISDRLIIMP